MMDAAPWRKHGNSAKTGQAHEDSSATACRVSVLDIRTALSGSRVYASYATPVPHDLRKLFTERVPGAQIGVYGTQVTSRQENDMT